MTGVVRVARPASLPPAGDTLVVVEASAGTGKTFFLEHRVVDLILAGAELSQLLLVTFTEKAVAELRLRIRDLLDRLSRIEIDVPGDSVWEIDDDARRRLRAAVTAFDHAPIFTIHGFCHRVLVEDAFAARRLFEQSQVADEVAFDAAFGALLRERFARTLPDRDLLSAYLQTGSTVEDLRKLLLACARADAPVRRRTSPDAARGLFEALGTPAQREAVAAPMKNGNDRRWVREWLEELGKELARSRPDATLPELLALLDRVREPATKVEDKLTKQGDTSSPALLALRAMLKNASLDEAIAAELLPHLYARIAGDKAEAGLFDYDDMLELVWEALRDDRRGPELATRLRARTPWAMIDEFQDTDPVQWSIFRSVWMHAEAKGLAIVGDPKQAIYGFRGADVHTYIAAREEMVRAGATRIPLSVNRRSTEPLVAAVNHVLAGNFGMPLLDPRHGITYDEPVTAGADIRAEDPRAPITVFHLQEKLSADARRAAVALAIGEEIERLRAAPPPWTLRGAPQAFSLGQVMVLTRTNSDSTSIAAALRGRGLACALVEPEKLFRTREAAELASVLGAIAAPRDRSARLRALRTRFFDVPWADLIRVVDGPDHHPQIAQLFDWAQLAARRNYESLFRRLVEDSRFAERALVLGVGERAITNTWHLIELLLEAVARSRSDLHELVAQLRRWMDDDTSQPDERDVQRAETDVDAVRILTIHKAKGLEAPYVFVYGGIGGAPPSGVHTLRDASGRALLIGAPDPVTQKLLDASADAEDQRLAYVALTRAQVYLYLPLYTGDLTKGASYKPVQTCLAASVASRAAHARPLFDVRPIAVVDDDEPPPADDALAALRPEPVPYVAELPAIGPARAGLAMLSYTRLAAHPDADVLAARAGDILAFDPAEFDVDDSVGEVGPGELPPGANAGLLLHDALELVDVTALGADPLEWAARPGIHALLADAARTRGIERGCLPHAAAIVHRTLTAPLALIDGTTLPPLASAPRFAREVEFSYPTPSGRGLVKGFIDALVAWDDELWVLDYKSDLLVGEDVARSAQQRVLEKYAVQARLYALAADRMRGARRLAGLLFQFVRHDVVVPVRLAGDSLAAWTAWLARIPLLGSPGVTNEPTVGDR